MCRIPITGTTSQFGVQAFNEELDKMYEDIQLPEDQAWATMADDLRRAKERRNLFAKENQQLKRKLQALEQDNEEYVFSLCSHFLSMTAYAVPQDGNPSEAACTP